MSEKWIFISGYNGLYEVSSYGSVRSRERVTIDSLGRTRRFAGVVMSPALGTPAYYSVGLTKNKKTKRVRIHVLVAESFLPKPSPIHIVDHIDGDKLNNRLDNLRYVTHRDNCILGKTSARRSTKKSKYTGVTRTSDGKYWQAYKYMDGKHRYLGSYKSEVNAAKAYQEGNKLVGEKDD